MQGRNECCTVDKHNLGVSNRVELKANGTFFSNMVYLTFNYKMKIKLLSGSL